MSYILTEEFYEGKNFGLVNNAGWLPSIFANRRRQPAAQQEIIRAEIKDIQRAVMNLNQPLPEEFKTVLLSSLSRIKAATNEF